MLTLLLGGARSGKSSLAVELGGRHGGPVTFIATCEPTDAELVDRIARHRAGRPEWPTIEAPLDLASALSKAAGSLAIVDCLTLWVSNLMAAGLGDDEVLDRSSAAGATAAGRDEPTIVITNEVGLGVHPATSLGRRYRDLLGAVNQQWAACADRTVLMVAGRAVRLDDPWETVR